MAKKNGKTVVARVLSRQGDVLLKPIDAPPSAELEDVPTIDGPGVLLALGESSNHSHRVFGRAVRLAHFRDSSRVARVLVVEGRDGAEVRVVGGGSGGAPRHLPVSLAPGAYEVRTQRQYSAEDERMSRAVAD